LVPAYLNTLIGRFLISTDRQQIWTSVMVLSLIASVPLNILFVPWTLKLFANGAIGSVLSLFITELSMVIYGIRALPAGSLGWSNVRFGLRVMAASLTMGLVTWLLRDLFIAVPILVGALTYLGLVFGFGIVAPEDRALLAQMVRSVQARVRQQKPVIGAGGV
jgi:hypothetical protein